MKILTRTAHDSFSDRRTLRKRAALTLLMYVVCGLTLTAHITFADHHCHHHCDSAPHHDAPLTLSAGDTCSLDHRFVEEHHEEAVDPSASAKIFSPAIDTSESIVIIDTHSAAVAPSDTPAPRTAHGPTTPARAPPAS